MSQSADPAARSGAPTTSATAVEKSARAHEQRLHKALLRLAVCYAGVDASFDSQLVKLRNTLRSADTDKLRESIETVVTALTEMANKSKAANDNAEPQQSVLDLLGLLEVPGPEAVALADLQHNLQSCEASDVASLVKQIAALMQRAYDVPKTSEISVPVLFEYDGFSDFLDKLRLPGEHGLELSRLRKSVAAAKEETERLTLVDTVVTLLTDALHSRRAGVLDVSAVTVGEISKLLLGMLDWLGLPESMAHRMERVRTELQGGIDGHQVEGILRRIASIAHDQHTTLQQELSQIEIFLKQVTTRLQEIEQHLASASASSATLLESTEALNSDIQSQFTTIHSTINDDVELDVIKRVIDERLGTVSKSMDRFVQTERRRHEHDEQKIKELNSKLREMEDESQRLQQNIEEEHRKALTDPLTRTPNRRAFEMRYTDEFARWARYSRPLTLGILDIDHFKRVNDTYGHKAGDKVLRNIAELCAARLRTTDFFGRIGGEEFVLLLPETTLENALGVCNSLRTEIDRCLFRHKADIVPVTVSCGLSEARESDTQETLFERTDRALYQAKETGRNKVIAAND